MIELNAVSLDYPRSGTVLSDIHLNIDKGSFHFLVGPSGAGKSSLLRLLSLRLAPTRGEIALFSHPVHDLSREQKAAIRRRVGMVVQDYQLLEHLTVAQNIALPLRLAGRPRREIREHVKEMLEWVGLKNHEHSYPDVLSGGQKQRVAIARAVIAKPDIILADEPTGNLDYHLSIKFMQLFEALNRMGTTILMATHDEHIISRFDFPIIQLQDGCIRRPA